LICLVLRFEPLYIPRLGDLEAGVLQRFDKNSSL
jgi:hypothetical protein